MPEIYTDKINAISLHDPHDYNCMCLAGNKVLNLNLFQLQLNFQNYNYYLLDTQFYFKH